MSIFKTNIIESTQDVILSDEDRHQAFKIAQGFAYHYAVLYEDAATPDYRTSCREHAQTWAMITEAMRRLS